MITISNKTVFVVLFLLIFSPITAYSVCDCGSVDEGSPCTGSGIIVTVDDQGANGDDVESVFTWSFNSGGSDVRCGQFANGDFWIAPGSGESDVTVTALTGSDTVYLDADPHSGSCGMLDNSPAYSCYDASEIVSLPQTYSTATSLVAAIQRDEAAADVDGCGTSAIEGSCVDSYNVITVLTSVPDNAGSDMIRPNIVGTKEYLTWDDFDLTRIPEKTYLTGTDAAGLEVIRQKWSHSVEIFSYGWTDDSWTTSYGNSEGGRAFRSHILIDDYGGGAAKAYHNDLATLFSDDNTLADKKESLAAMLTYGLDLYHARFDPPSGYATRWQSGAGQHLGKFTSVALLAALEISNSTRFSNVQGVASADNLIQPQELQQLWVGDNGPVWGDWIDDDAGTIQRYYTDFRSSGCYDTNWEHENLDYSVYGEWKTITLPVGEHYTGSGFHFAMVLSNFGGLSSDMRIRNVDIDGTDIDFDVVTLVDHGGTNDDETITDGVLYVTAGDTYTKRTSESYTIASDSELTFDFYQTEEGRHTSIGFDENDIDDDDRLFILTGTYPPASRINLGCDPSVGKKTAADPHHYIDGPANLPGGSGVGSYFNISYDGITNFTGIMFLLPEFCQVVNTTRTVDFVDRVRSHGILTLPDPCVTPDTREADTCSMWGSGTGCDYYYPTAAITETWGPISLTDPDLGCVETVTSGYTQTGRFASIDGREVVNGSYVSSQISSNWATIRGSGGCWRTSNFNQTGTINLNQTGTLNFTE